MGQTQQVLEGLKSKLTHEEYLRLQTALATHLIEKPRTHLARIPLVLPVLATFGFVATLYGMEKILDQTGLVNHPLELIALGIVILLITGAAANKL